MGRVVVGVDGSAGAQRALEWAADEASRRAAKLVVLHSYVPPSVVSGQPMAADFDVRRAAEALVVAAVDDVRARHPELEIERKVRVVRDSAARALVDEAAGASMLVVGSRGHGGFMALLVGSVGQQCLSHAGCPVVVVPGERVSEAARSDLQAEQGRESDLVQA